VHVEVKGQGLEGVPLEEVVALLSSLDDGGSRWQCSRLDLAWDYCGFSPATVNDAARRGDVRVPFRRRAGWRKFIDSAEAEPGCEGDDSEGQGGQTCYIGTAKSPRQLCVYNRRGFTRCEFRLRGDRATAVLCDLLTYPAEKWSRRAMDHLCDFISFCDAAADTCISRAVPLPWWESFIGDACRACLRLPRAVPRLFESATERRKRCTRELAVQAEVFGLKFMLREMKAAKKVLSDEDHRRVRVLRAAVRLVADELGPDVSGRSCWPDPTACEVLRAWSREYERVA
jgi:DNA relaxase NicK